MLLIQAIVLKPSSRNDPKEVVPVYPVRFVPLSIPSISFLARLCSPSIRIPSWIPSPLTSVVNLSSCIYRLFFFIFSYILRGSVAFSSRFPPWTFDSRVSHLNSRLCQSELKPRLFIWSHVITTDRQATGGCFGRYLLRIRARRAEIEDKKKRKRKNENSVLRNVARGEDASPSENSLVTMNGANESREPIKDYSRR